MSAASQDQKLGALTFSFIKSVTESKPESIMDLYEKTCQHIESEGFEQDPVLSSNKKIDLEHSFSLNPDLH